MSFELQAVSSGGKGLELKQGILCYLIKMILSIFQIKNKTHK